MTLIFFSLIYGLIISTDKTTENGGLFFAEYLRLKSDLGEEITEFDRQVFDEKMKRAKVKDGLYKRDETRNVRTVSHDEISGFMVASELLGTGHKEEVWAYLKDNFFIYDFNYSRPYPAFHPAWIYFWGELNGETWTKVFFPLALINIMLATRDGSQKETSGKLLYFTLLKRDSFLWQVFTQRLLKLYGKSWAKEIFSIYFPQESEDHPLIFLSRKYADRGYNSSVNRRLDSIENP